MTKTSYTYYERQSVLPTYGEFTSAGDLEAHERLRRRLFTDKLGLPPRVFAGARLLEFGPDSGENSLVFALWGAECTLAEPHVKAHPFIGEYFERFGLADRLDALEAWDVATYPVPAPDARFDFVDAEGFIYTIQPSSLWIDKLSGLVREDGFAIVDYYESFGCLLELVWKVVHARFRKLTGAPSVDAARRVFETKWSSIPHKRSFESWTMDVLENPFVRLRYFLEPVALAAEMSAVGFRLHSSWPQYNDALEVHWYKLELAVEEELRLQSDFVRRSRLSHLLGRKHFLIRLDPSLEVDLRELVENVDALIDDFDQARARRCDEILASVSTLLGSDAVLSTLDATAGSLETVDALRRLLELLARGSADEIAAFCNAEPGFINGWAMPNHFAVFRRTAQ